MPRSASWYCSYCRSGPLNYVLDDYCPHCYLRRTTDCIVDYSIRIAAQPSTGPNPQVELVPQDEVIKENLWHSVAHDRDVVLQEQFPSLTTPTDREEPLRDQSVASKPAHLQSSPKRAATKRHAPPPDSQTPLEHGIKSASTPTGSLAKKSKLEGNILDGSRFGSTSAQSLLEYYLFNQENPISEDLVTYAVRLPGELSFSLETLEPATTPRRRPHSPNSRARIARVRNNGGACADCRKKKKACVHRLQELEAVIDGDCAPSHPGVAPNAQQNAFAPRTLAPVALDEHLEETEEASTSYRIPSIGVGLPRQRRRRRRTSRRNVETETTICSPYTSDHMSPVTPPRPGRSDAIEIGNRLPHTFSPFGVAMATNGQGQAEQGNSTSSGHDTNYPSNDSSRRLRDRPPNQMIREPAQRLYATNETSVETNGHPSTNNLNNTRLSTAFSYSEQSLHLHQMIDNTRESQWSLPPPTYQDGFGTQNDTSPFNVDFVLLSQHDPGQQPAHTDFQPDALMFDEESMSGRAYTQLDPEFIPPYVEISLFEQLTADNEAGHRSQSIGTRMNATQFEFWQPLSYTGRSFRSPLGGNTHVEQNPSSGNSVSTLRSENTTTASSGSIVTPKSSEGYEFIDPRLL